MTDFLPFIAALLAAGAAAGLVSGLFGIGGGVVIVPTLLYVFSALGYPDTAMHAAVATSLATIVVTSLRSARAHYGHGALDLDLVKSWAPWIVLGAAFGASVAGMMTPDALRRLFGAVALVVAAQFIFGRPTWRLWSEAPNGLTRAGLSGGLGFLSSLMGIGGGVFGVTIMTLFGKPIHQAVGTAALLGAVIGAPAAIGFVATGWAEPGRAPGSFGYVSLPAFAIIIAMTLVMAPIGARLAHSLNGTTLRRLFGAVLGLVALNMLFDLI